jgi:uncharacterized protein YecE (DUF72 family)
VEVKAYVRAPHRNLRLGLPTLEGRLLIESLAREVELELDDSRDVFVYFNNDYRGHAVENALLLMENLGVEDRINA